MNQFRLSRRLKPVVVLLASALLAGACVHQGGPTVGVAKLEANLVFGVQEKPAPPSAGLGDIPAPVASGAPQFLEFPTPDIQSDVGSTTSPAVSCPAASVTAAPEKATEAFVTGPPLEGLTRWKRGGTVDVGGVKVPYQGFEPRITRNYKKIDDNTSTFETVKLLPDGTGYEVDYYQVKTNGTQTTQGGGTNSVPGVVPTVTVQEPEAGLVLKQRDYVVNGQTTTFHPGGNGVLLLPLPVTSGQTWKSVAVDNKSGATIELDGTVTRRQRIDACGDLVDGWQVETQWTDSTNKYGTLTYNYMVATQYGAMLIDEVFQAGKAGGVSGQQLPGTPASPPTYPNDISFQLAQLKPGAVPAGLVL